MNHIQTRLNTKNASGSGWTKSNPTMLNTLAQLKLGIKKKIIINFQIK